MRAHPGLQTEGPTPVLRVAPPDPGHPPGAGPHPRPSGAHPPLVLEAGRQGCAPEPHLGLVVVLHGHGDDVDPDDEGDEKVEVVAGAQRVDGAAGGRVVSVVGPALGLCRERAPVTRAR